jgi:propionate CoA-transferase
VLYVTERCVFRLTGDGLELIEVAPGIDIERDILARMEFRPLVRAPQTMEAAVFTADPMGLRERLLSIPLAKRFSYDDKLNVLFINFERLDVRTQRDVDAIRREVEARVKPLGHKVFAVVNYTGTTIAPDILDAYTRMVGDLAAAYYIDVTRYGTGGFLRLLLGDALTRRGLAPHIYLSAEEAQAHLSAAPHR